ncbi:MAG: pyridine nucleotide-disulfide oxidoreductase, partial [Betaproteobacteria bacterium]
MLELGFGLNFHDLYSCAGLRRIDAAFGAWIEHADAALAARLAAARADPAALTRLQESELLIALAPHLEDWLALLFGIEREVAALQAAQQELAPLFACKRQVVQRKAMNKYKAVEAATFDGAALRAALEQKIGERLTTQGGELAFALKVGEWAAAGESEDAAHADDIDLALRYAAWAAHTPEGKALHKAGVLFKAPRKLDYMRLVPVERETRDGVDRLALSESHTRRREGFALTDAGTDLVGALDQAHYCIWC